MLHNLCCLLTPPQDSVICNNKLPNKMNLKDKLIPEEVFKKLMLIHQQRNKFILSLKLKSRMGTIITLI